MTTIRFEMDQNVICAPDCGDRSGMLGVITGLRVLRFGFGADQKAGKMAYRVKWADGIETPATKSALLPAPPQRGDMDTKVGWSWFDPAVARAIKGETA